MGKQSNNPQSSISTVDKAFIAQQASAEFTRVVSEIHGLFFQQLQQLSQSPAMGAAAIPAYQQLTSSMQTASVIQAGLSLAELAALATPGYGPFIGAAVMAAVVLHQAGFHRMRTSNSHNSLTLDLFHKSTHRVPDCR